MKITAFNGSPKGASGNTDVMAKAFMKGAETAGAETEIIHLADKDFNHCKACGNCMGSNGKCIIKDYMGDLQGLNLNKIHAAIKSLSMQYESGGS